ncbi:phytoene/squalene synthase family protein [Halomonas tibetensis]|uniref:Phytoene/squalene synthase family protein n=1 Tax=Halomonas tibetensis TaxID=2259590 RepID=A0ABV7B625_9GAMM
MTTDAHAQATLRKHSKSFYWAGRFLSREELDKGARLYRICRQVDDWADDAHSREEIRQAHRRLVALHDSLSGSHGDTALSSLSVDEARHVVDLQAHIRDLFGHDSVSIQAMRDLLLTMMGDLSLVRIDDDAELLSYAYGAAGTVGVMMCHCLEAREIDAARAFAIDMGMAMQMTNIARDVLEDAQRDRIYLPRTWMTREVSAEAICRGDTGARHTAWMAVKKLVARAEHYYASGWEGLAYLPPRPRLAIAVAGRVYRDIGRRILRMEEDRYWASRVTVPKMGKAHQSLLALAQVPWRETSPSHDSRLHEPLHRRLAPFYSSRDAPP